MPASAWVMLALLVAMFGLLFATRLPPASIFLGVLTVCLTFHLAPEGELLAGFANPGVLTVGVLFVVAAGMYSTGAVNRVVDQLIGLPRTLGEALGKLLPLVAGSSAFLNNTPLVAMMVPVVRDVTRATGLSASKLYLPLSYASILGGASTLIGTSTNLIIAGLVTEQLALAVPGAPPMRNVAFFDPALVGVPAAVVGLLFLIFVGVRLLPARTEAESSEHTAFSRVYRVELDVAADGPLVSRTLDAAGLAHPKGCELVGWWRSDGTSVHGEGEALRAGDRLALTADHDAVGVLWSTSGLLPHPGLRFPTAVDGTTTGRRDGSLVEAVIARANPAVGRTIADLPPAATTDAEVQLIGLSRDGCPPTGALADVTMRPGDVATLEVTPAFFFSERREEHFSLTKRFREVQLPRTERATLALLITGAMVALAAFGVMSMLNAALLAAAAMVMTGCVTYRAAWRSLELETLVILAAAIGLEAPVTASGLAQAVGTLMTSLAGDSPSVALAVVFVGCIVMTNLITNAAAAAFMFPIALAVATNLGVNFMPFVIALMLGTSYAFISPAGYQTNLMVLGPGGYTFTDFAKVGIPLTILVGIVTVVLAPLVFGF
ncbi:MAG: SLC13 family permease [Chloroflexi bacterium]|nr:SLC13 family permease [Chloroflexota bacterium]